MSLISKLLDVYNGTTDPDVVIDVWFNLSAGSNVGDVAYVLKSQGERYEVKQKVTKYYVWDGSEWISELDAIARVSESANYNDHHSGYNRIQVGETVTIQQYKQMINYGGLIIKGTLDIKGDLILK